MGGVHAAVERGSRARSRSTAQQEGELLELTRWLREQGQGYSGVDLAQALSGVQAIARRTGEAFSAYDVVLTPTLSGPPAFPE